MSDGEDLTEYRVPITVFTTVRAVDYSDAAYIAERAVAQALRSAAVTTSPSQVIVAKFHKPDRVDEEPVTVHKVHETGTAAGSGLLWLRATDRAYPRIAEEAPYVQ